MYFGYFNKSLELQKNKQNDVDYSRCAVFLDGRLMKLCIAIGIELLDRYVNVASRDRLR